MAKNFYTQKIKLKILDREFSVDSRIRRPKLTDESTDLKDGYSKHLDLIVSDLVVEAENAFMLNNIFSLKNISRTMELSIKGLFSDLRPHLKDNFISKINLIAEEYSLYNTIKTDPRFAEYHTIYDSRNLKRKWKAILGPTNSGKTFHCIEALTKAKKAIYLSPLRLMAIENQEKIEKLGIKCSLLTGEESDIKEGATHICCTTEMFSAFKDETFDLVIVDEVQKIEDIERGNAVVSALVSAQSPLIYMTGPHWIKNKIQRLCDLCNDDFEYIKTERLTPLIVDSHVTKLNKLKPKTIVVVFSRKNALAMKANLESLDYKISIIYGALSPKVRREQSRRFCEGETDILVATDAIGMGLNLPADKVVFSTATKFDGKSNRLLNSEEAKQIAGRAGRFGLSNSFGAVGALDNDTLKAMRRLVNESDTVVNENSLFRIKPDLQQLLRIQDITKNNSLRDNYLLFNSIANNSQNYISEIDREHLTWIERIDKVFPDECLKFKYNISKVPFKSHAYDATADFSIKMAKKVLKNETIGLHYIKSRNKKDLEELELTSQLIDIYNHLSGDYPNCFVENTEDLRSLINNHILIALDEKK